MKFKKAMLKVMDGKTIIRSDNGDLLKDRGHLLMSFDLGKTWELKIILTRSEILGQWTVVKEKY